ncbi:putative DNA binding domain-containing protein [Bacillus mobilis]|uniref:AlbA family DNA-binding domain-containing protein n=1 Tax=Bacillus mobilis TaxID=2026190 RepID=UPI002E1DEC6F|nr:putative DNA binding domain-containing protein [Bacillus mobilis]
MNKEEFAKFLEEPTRESLRDILKNQSGEHNELDFKQQWPNAGKLAKHILAFCNYGGGCLIIGVQENENGLESIGVLKFKKKEDVFREIANFLPKDLLNELAIFDFEYKESEYALIKDKKFQVLIVNDLPHKAPFVSFKDGDGIKKDRIYTRRGIESVEASYEEIQKIINKRIETGYSSSSEIELETHLSQLKTLYEQIKKHTHYSWIDTSKTLAEMFYATSNGFKKEKNPNYPKEDYEEFISKMIEKKKKKIELELDVLGIEN